VIILFFIVYLFNILQNNVISFLFFYFVYDKYLILKFIGLFKVYIKHFNHACYYCCFYV